MDALAKADDRAATVIHIYLIQYQTIGHTGLERKNTNNHSLISKLIEVAGLCHNKSTPLLGYRPKARSFHPCQFLPSFLCLIFSTSFFGLPCSLCPCGLHCSRKRHVLTNYYFLLTCWRFWRFLQVGCYNTCRTTCLFNEFVGNIILL